MVTVMPPGEPANEVDESSPEERLPTGAVALARPGIPGKLAEAVEAQGRRITESGDTIRKEALTTIEAEMRRIEQQSAAAGQEKPPAEAW
jgi:hypothetical protein